MGKKPITPIPTRISKEYWEAAKRHEFIIQKCEECSKHVFYPRAFCPHCLSSRLKWVKASGSGVIHTYSIVHKMSMMNFKKKTPYNIAIIELDEGVRLMSEVINCSPEELEIGKRVKVVFEDITERYSIPKFILEKSS